MNSEDTDAVIDQDGKLGALLPKLRFPEFQNAEGWEAKPLEKVCEVNPSNSGLPATFIYIDLGAVEAGNLAATNRISREGAPSRAQRLLEKGDILFQTVRPYQRNNFLFDIDENDFVASTGYAQLRSNGPAEYLYQLIHTDDFVDKVIASCTGSNYPAINSSDLAQIPLPVPRLHEQQKIANCLSSVDGLIAAEADKLEALKDHKKGLMQQLFPAPGEAVPPVRFPEFKDEGDWKWKAINEIADLHKGKGISKSDIAVKGNHQCIRYGELYTTYGEVIDEILSKTNLPSSELFMSRMNDVIIPSSGETKIDIATASCVMRDDIALGGDLNVIRSRQNGIFLSYFLNGPLKYEIAKVAQGDSVVHLYPTQIGSLRVAVPKAKEQLKIALCLYSVDTLITMLGDRIDVLKVHKKGLMQQLFPVAKEVRG